MSITPQTIKDQEFQTKFRGYDIIEVKAYLDVVAEEFFNLLEAKQRQDEEVATLQGRCQNLTDEKSGLEAKARAKDSEIATLKDRCQNLTDEKNGLEARVRAANDSARTSDEETARAQEAETRTLREQTATLMKQVKNAEAEKAALLFAKESRDRALAEEIRSLGDKLMLVQRSAAVKDKDIEGLKQQLAASETKIGELKKDESDFKNLIIAAQNFADDLRHKSEKEAGEMMVKARAEVEAFRLKAEKELARLPVEIEGLHQLREQVGNELRHLLQTHLENLNFSSKFKESSPNLSETAHAVAEPGNGEAER
ncbi:MAG: DivIVA domain-containing protein [Desulfobulbaceae bacterium]|jgi:DivIVA domain-containing protein|nr:DivIVA domain-containing protein [Desulfobulbaceae bacterium]